MSAAGHTAFVRGAYVPESVALVIVGAAVGAFAPTARSLISADLVLLVFVPGLVFDAAFDLDWRVARALLPALIGLAVPGVLISAAAVAIGLNALAGIPFGLAFVIGAITSATDPVAVVSILTRLRIPATLRTLIEGESLLNDGTGLVLVALAVTAVSRGLDVSTSTGVFVVTILGSIALGVLAGISGTIAVRVARHPMIAFGISVPLAYGTYALAAGIGLSGVLATVTTAAVLGNLLRRSWADAVLARQLDRGWAVIALVLSALTFLSIGVSVDVASLSASAGAIAVGVLAVVAARAIFIYLPAAIIGAPDGWALVTFWSGLRGAIAFAAALALPASLAQRSELQTVAFGIVLVTLVFFGTTAPLVIRRALGAVPVES